MLVSVKKRVKKRGRERERERARERHDINNSWDLICMRRPGSCPQHSLSLLLTDGRGAREEDEEEEEMGRRQGDGSAY